MMEGSSSRLVDVRGLSQTRETLAYKDGGLFPVLALADDGAIVAVLRGGAGHVGLTGRMEVIRSLDGGQTWTPPAVVADSDRDDRNPAFGCSAAGTLVLAYHRQGGYDAAGNYRPVRGVADRPVEIMVTRSRDHGLTWERPRLLGVAALRAGSPYGKMVALADGTLLLPIYDEPNPAVAGTMAGSVRPGASCSYLVRSRDDGLTWEEPSLIGANMNETGLLLLPDGDLLAIMRDDADDRQALWSTRSADGGHRWSAPVQLTGSRQHPADLVLLGNGDVLLTYGNRTPPYRIEGLVSRDGGRSWLAGKLAFSGSLYGYTVMAPRPTDLGYPSSVIRRVGGSGQGVTMYYYHPSLSRPATWSDRQAEPRYLARDYLAVAISWDEAELIAAIDRTLAGRA